MSTITRERVANLLQFNSEGSDCQSNAEQWEVHELARIALASLEADAVAYVDPFAFHNFSVYRAGETDNKRMGREWMWANPDAGLIPVYTAPPAPVSMKDHQIRELVNELRDIAVEYHGTQQLRERIARTVRAAMLQGVENAETPTTMQTAPALDSSPKIAESPTGINQGKSEPVTADYKLPEGWVAVPVEPTYQMCEAMGLPWESPRFPDRYKSMLSAAPQQEDQ